MVVPIKFVVYFRYELLTCTSSLIAFKSKVVPLLKSHSHQRTPTDLISLFGSRNEESKLLS